MAEIKQHIPKQDFVDVQYDIDFGTQTSDVLVILSTPRSGSTLLCEMLRVNGACLPHEYCQPYQYLKILADRWECLDKGELDVANYVSQLRKYRTYPNGWLGINLHGSHLKVFLDMESHFSDIRFHYVHIMRRNEIAQAVSYYIASTTGQWSSHFEAPSSPSYSFNEIRIKLGEIRRQNTMIHSYLAKKRKRHMTIHYEDLVSNPEDILQSLSCIDEEKNLNVKSNIKKQSNELSQKWIEKFTREFTKINIPNADETAIQKLFRCIRHYLKS